MAASIVISDSDSETDEDLHSLPRVPLVSRRPFSQVTRAEEKLRQTSKSRENKAPARPGGARAQSRVGQQQSSNPRERLRQMVLVLDSSLAENCELMESLVEELEEAGVEHRVCHGGAPAGGVRWRRKQRERVVSSDGQLTEVVTEAEEGHLLLTLEAQGFAGLIHYTKMAEQGLSLPPGVQTLEGYIKETKRGQYADKTISLAAEGMDKYFRGSKTKEKRNFRKQVLAGATAAERVTATAAPGLSDVTWLECQAAIVSLQLATGCSVRLCSGPEELAEHIFTFTKAVCEKPFRKKSCFSFHPDAATAQRKKAESGGQVGTTWKNQLMQLNNLSEAMASAIVAVYPSPAHLISAYSTMEKESAALLLQDITIRRGVGTVASTKRLGPVQSRRIHTLLTTTDPQVKIM